MSERTIPDWQVAKILKLLRMYPLGLTRDDLRRKFGYASTSTLAPVIKHLLDHGQVKTTPPGFGVQKIILVRRDNEGT